MTDFDRIKIDAASLDGVRKLSAFHVVSRELIDDIPFNIMAAFRPDTRTPEQRAIDEMNRAAERAEAQAVVDARHAAALARVSPALRPILELHQPVFTQWSWDGECRGCDFAGAEAEYPQWPCRTWELAAGESDV